MTANAVLRCCSTALLNVNGKNDAKARKRAALLFAMEIFQTIHTGKKMRPSYHTYTLFLTVCRRASGGKEYEQLVEMAFKLCTSNGLLDKKTFRNLTKEAPKALVRRLVGRGGRISFEQLPKEWSKNI